MNVVFADTFYFLALINKSDPAHPLAVEYRSKPWRIITTAWVLTEVADALSLPDNRRVFLDLLDTIYDSEDAFVLEPNQKSFDEGLTLFRQRADKRWSLTDCISFQVMLATEVEAALTGDKHFKQAGFQILFPNA